MGIVGKEDWWIMVFGCKVQKQDDRMPRDPGKGTLLGRPDKNEPILLDAVTQSRLNPTHPWCISPSIALYARLGKTGQRCAGLETVLSQCPATLGFFWLFSGLPYKVDLSWIPLSATSCFCTMCLGIMDKLPLWHPVAYPTHWAMTSYIDESWSWDCFCFLRIYNSFWVLPDCLARSGKLK